jgi:hypothetical protein
MGLSSTDGGSGEGQEPCWEELETWLTEKRNFISVEEVTKQHTITIQ